MNEALTKLQESIVEIESLKQKKEWSTDFQIWEKRTGQLLLGVFGAEAKKMFDDQQTVTFTYYDFGDGNTNRRNYIKELENRKKVIENYIGKNKETVSSIQTSTLKSEKEVLKEIYKKSEALKENLIPTDEAKNLHESLVAHLENVLPSDTIPGLRYKKIKAERGRQTWWSNENGYPIESPWSRFNIYLELLAQHEAEKTIKQRFSTEEYFIESRSQGEDQHLIIGKRDGSPEKAHVIIDGKTGEIRVEDNQLEPTEIVKKIEGILTLPNGKRIRTTREAIEEIN